MKKIKENKKTIILILLFICYSLFISSFIRKETDYFWHIKVGEYMFKNGILTKDIFSWSVYGKYWMSHEWLFEYCLYIMKLIFGKFHLVLYVFFSVFSIMFISYLYNKEKMKDNQLFSFLWVVLSTVFVYVCQCRPHFVSYIFIALSLYFLYDFINKDGHKIYLMPLLTVLWSNFHGGSSNLGYLLCFIFGIVGLCNFSLSKIEATKLPKTKKTTLFIIGFISALCTMINIHGYKMFLYPYANMMNSSMLKHILEWQPTVLSDFSHYPFFLLALFIISMVLISDKKIKLIDLCVFGIALFLGLKSVRFWAFIYIFSSFFIFDYVDEFSGIDVSKIIIFFNVCIFALFLMNYKSINTEINKKYVNLNEKIIDKLKKAKPERLFNHYNAGGELVYYDIPVFIDGRADLYSDHGIFDRYFSINDTNNDYLSLLREYDFDYLLVGKGSYFYNYINLTNAYDTYYKDDDFVIYKKKAS